MRCGERRRSAQASSTVMYGEGAGVAGRLAASSRSTSSRTMRRSASLSAATGSPQGVIVSLPKTPAPDRSRPAPAICQHLVALQLGVLDDLRRAVHNRNIRHIALPIGFLAVLRSATRVGVLRFGIRRERCRP